MSSFDSATQSSMPISSPWPRSNSDSKPRLFLFIGKKWQVVLIAPFPPCVEVTSDSKQFLAFLSISKLQQVSQCSRQE